MQVTATTKAKRSTARPAVRPARRAPLTREQELQEMNAYVSQIKNSSRKDAVALLQRAGIYDEQGQLAEQFRT